MKLTDLWSSKKKPTISFELFPPRTEKAAATFGHALDELVALKPDFVAVTFGAGGSTREGSRQLIETLKKDKKQEVIAYFAGYGLSPNQITSILDDYAGIGIENILVVRGDPPHGDSTFQPHPESFAHASDILQFVRPRYKLCIGAAGYPEGHLEAKDKNQDLEHLKVKVATGAEFIIANYFYDNAFFFDFTDRCRKAGITVPILPGLMPIYSVKMMRRLAEICGATIPNELGRKVAEIPEEDMDSLAALGIEYATDQARGLIKAGVPGLHIYTMNRSHASVAIVNQLRQEGLI